MGESDIEEIIDSTDEDSSSKKAPSISDDNDVTDSLLFIDDTGESLSFILALRSYEDIQKYTKLIKDRCGHVKVLKEFGDYDAILVPDGCKHSTHNNGDVFYVSYLDDCVKKGRLLDISSYKPNVSPGSKIVDNFKYMDIIYKKLYKWDTLPETFLKSNPVPKDPPKRSVEDRLLDSSDDESIFSNRPRSPKVFKRTKSLFSEDEKREMVKYIFKRKRFDLIKGNVFWKEMERHNICPIRTWQSLKNHFNKSLVYELNNRCFNLPKEDLQEFRRWYFHKDSRKTGKASCIR